MDVARIDNCPCIYAAHPTVVDFRGIPLRVSMSRLALPGDLIAGRPHRLLSRRVDRSERPSRRRSPPARRH
jgi:hypothetical protein